MNAEKELINQIRQLRQIKPNSDWSASVRAQIVGHEEIGQNRSILSVFGNLFVQYRIALAGIAAFLMVGGTAVLAQSALPGEPLYALKRATEKGITLVTGNNKIAAANLELAAKRLKEIDLISQKNLVKNLPVAFEEYKNAKSTAKKEVAAQIAKNPANAAKIVKDAAVAMKDINEKEKQVYGALGVEQNASTTEDIADAASDKAIVGSLIDSLDGNDNLAEDQQKDLAAVKVLYDAGDYRQALDQYLNSSLNK
jgi:hypothetical protein